MRLTELSLENYGGFANRELTIPETAGLTLVFGANEAGKSTCLEAISDFLFSIPKNTQRGSLFGYDGMRIGASMRLVDGTSLTLKRRKGNGRTLADAAGTAFEDSILAPVLGAITRDRFETLFGLNHETLRNGGERLLHAEGEIGRLIVEAGGGLRALVSRLDDLGAEANLLFDTRRSASRLYYQQLAVFEAADKTARGAQLSRETYEQSRRAAIAAEKSLSGLRDERRNLAISRSKLERGLRVSPHLRQLDHLTTALAAYEDIAFFPADFAARARAAADARDAAVNAQERAVERQDRIKARLDAIFVDLPLKERESDIRSLGERALHVSKARSDRANRQAEIDKGEAEMASLRQMLGVTPDTDLLPLLPGQAALEKIRRLADEATERRPGLANAEQRAIELQEKISVLDDRLDTARQKGFDVPSEASSSAFASLAAQKSSLLARQQQLDAGTVTLSTALTALGFRSLEELAAFACPSADDIRAEKIAQEGLAAQIDAQAQLKRQAQRDIATAEREAADLEASGRIATDASLAEARELRTEAWTPIRSSYVDGQLPEDGNVREQGAAAFDAALTSADELADRRAEEAERAASFAQTHRRIAEGKDRVSAAQEEESAFTQHYERRVAAWSNSLPEAHARHADLPALLLFAEKRHQLLQDAEKLGQEANALHLENAQLAPTTDLLERVERGRGLDPSQPFGERVGAVQSAISRHEQAHADFLRDERDRADLLRQHKTSETDLRDLRAAQATWDAAWPLACSVLGLSGDIAPAQGSDAAAEWANARGVLSAIGQSRHRLKRMDEDEALLGSDVAAVAAQLQIEVGSDCVVAAQMLVTRLDANVIAQTQYDGLLPDYEEAKVDRGLAQDALTAADEQLASLAAIVKLEATTVPLADAAARCEARAALLREKSQAEHTASEIGDGLDLLSLRTEWGGRDLDEIRAELEDQTSRAAEVESEIEAAVLAEKQALDELAGYLSESQVNHAVAEREAASAQMHLALERYLELSVAHDLVISAMATIRSEQQDPLILRAGALFAATTLGEFSGIETDIDDKGQPVVVGRRANGGRTSVAMMSDGTRDQLFLAFRLASLENYAEATEPLPFIADDILVHFDDDRGRSTLELLGEFGKKNQVLLFTHHRSVRDMAMPLVERGDASVIDLARPA
ncbi:AAA family ATPase [Sphingopyxis sp. OPL5]|uniref:ATP-binding protein n=1 Tax=Sphingopyxis sp. OPL5 TaxID=2486273 RepID=UPI00164D709C|nr:YhaN family protein [Sphingopyxis sp. OPL5]QNO27845.1 AAA family ATPase [Sphingopyxis sp. OPL5]